MKQFCFLMICLLLIAACKKTTVQPSSYSYSFVANTQQFTGNGYTASYKRDTVSGNLVFEALLYEGAPADSLFVRIKFGASNYIDTGTYSNVGPLTFYDAGYIYAEDYGTYSISKLDTANHLISGTFQFRGNCSLEQVLFQNVNSGVFTNLTYKTQ
jgi:hypothetical protein